MFGISKLNSISKVISSGSGSGSRTARTITSVGTVSANTTTKKFGTASLTAPSSTANGLTSTLTGLPVSNFTIEFWCYLNSSSLGQMISTTDGGGLVVYSGSSWSIYSNGVSYVKNITYSLSLNTWHHVAIVNNAGTFSLYVDGTLRGTTWNDTTDWLDEHLILSTDTLAILGTANGYSGVDGYIDEFRISKSVRYTTTFTPSTTAFTNDTNTILLLHMDSSPFVDDNA